MAVHQPSIIGISESWCRDSIDDAEINLHGYDLFRSDRGGGVRGGGNLLYVRGTLQASAYDTVSADGEWVCCRICNEKGRDLVVGVCYRSEKYHKPGVDNHKGIRGWLTELQNKNMVIMGDMNYSDIDWDSRIGRSSDAQLFIDCLDDAFLTQHVQQNTRGISRLDLVISRDPDIVQDLYVLDKLATSDHNTILFRIVFNRAYDIVKRHMYDYNKADFTIIREHLKVRDWTLACEGDMEAEWHKFRGTLQLLEAEV